MPSTPPADEIARDACWLAQALDPSAGVVRFVAMARDSYRAASFLDDRLMQQPVNAEIVPWPDVEAAVEGDCRTDARWIFHIGHVGSTLVSRLLGEIEGVLAIREPRLLRDLALIAAEVRGRYIQPVSKLMSRTFGNDELACVKATSFASEIAPQLVPTGERALFMFANPRNYVASILAGENSVRELHALTNYRDQRLSARGISFPVARNDADRAAQAWACEMTTLEAAADAMADRRIEWADFDAMLANMACEIGRVAAFFQFNAEAEQIERIVNGPLMQRYSKDPRYEYSPTLRRDLVAQEFELRGGEIEDGLALLAAAAEKSPLLARAMLRTQG